MSNCWPMIVFAALARLYPWWCESLLGMNPLHGTSLHIATRPAADQPADVWALLGLSDWADTSVSLDAVLHESSGP